MEQEGVDVAVPEIRSRMMRAVRQVDTAPEMAVRKLLRECGVFYRVRNRDLPGSPDIANRSRRWALFVHGCFWHGHADCRKTKGGRAGRIPKTNSEFWAKKIAGRARDARKSGELEALGYRVFVVWECELRDRAALKTRLSKVFTNDRGARHGA